MSIPLTEPKTTAIVEATIRTWGGVPEKRDYLIEHRILTKEVLSRLHINGYNLLGMWVLSDGNAFIGAFPVWSEVQLFFRNMRAIVVYYDHD